jgi:ribonuclease HII
MDYSYEQKLIDQGHKIICGIDEAGRGPLAGPLVAAAVIVDVSKLELFTDIDESKSLTSKKREEFFNLIINNVLAWSVGISRHDEIDQQGIAFANQMAMKRAWKYLSITPDYILFDHVWNLHFLTPHEAIIKGDKTVISIAMASIVAKVMHDRMIDAYDRIYPEYEFAKHKGYGTALHMAKIKEFGPCPIHRRSFAGVA